MHVWSIQYSIPGKSLWLHSMSLCVYTCSYLPKPTVKVTFLPQVYVDPLLIQHRKVVPLFSNVAGTVRLEQTTPDMSVHSCVSQIIRALISSSFWCFPSTDHLRSIPLLTQWNITVSPVIAFEGPMISACKNEMLKSTIIIAYQNVIFGSSLSEPHINGSAHGIMVCIYLCIIYPAFLSHSGFRAPCMPWNAPCMMCSCDWQPWLIVCRKDYQPRQVGECADTR